jgi:hypothetical protein
MNIYDYGTWLIIADLESIEGEPVCKPFDRKMTFEDEELVVSLIHEQEEICFIHFAHDQAQITIHGPKNFKTFRRLYTYKAKPTSKIAPLIKKSLKRWCKEASGSETGKAITKHLRNRFEHIVEYLL